MKLSGGGSNWYLRVRCQGRYRDKSLKTQDLMEARRTATYNPPDANTKTSVSIKRALLDFQESRQQLIDAPTEETAIRLNTFNTYVARVKSLIEFFDYMKVANKETMVRTIGSLKQSDFAKYKHWRERAGIMITTIKTEISQINTILKWFCENDYICNMISVELPRVDHDKIRPANRIPTRHEKETIELTLKRLCNSGDDSTRRGWQLYALWLKWLEETYTRPHESRLLKIKDVKERKVDNKKAVEFYTSSKTKTGKRLVYATSSVMSELIDLYQDWRLQISLESPLFILPSSGKSPSVNWYSDKWRQLIKESGISVASRELTQYSLRHEGINTLLVQGIPATKVADLAGHSLAIQQRIYKKYQLENDHSVLRRDDLKSDLTVTETGIHAAIPYPYEIDEKSGKWFPDDYLESTPDEI